MDVEIQLSGSGLVYKGIVTLFQATQIMAFISKPIDQGPDIIGAEERPSLQSTTRTDAQANAQVYESPRLAIDSLGAKTNPQKIVAIAFYLGATSQNGQTFTTEEVLKGFAGAGERTPKNITRDLRDAVTAGYIFADDKSGFRLLSATDNVPTEGFKKVKTKRRTTPKQGNESKKTKATVRDEISKLPIITSLNGYVDLFDLKVRGDQLLWLIQYAKSHQVTSVNRQEVIYIAKKMGTSLDSQNFASSNTPNVKNGYISSEGDLMSLTPKGEKHLKDITKNESNT